MEISTLCAKICIEFEEYIMEKILVTRSSMPSLEEYIDEIAELWDTHWLTNMGPKHCQLQEMLRDYLHVQNVELLTNGHMALELSLQALKLGNKVEQAEVITTPFTFASTTHAIVRNGLTPIFCDINGDDFTIDSAKIETLINKNTVAIMPVHVYGNVCDIKRISEIANKYNLKVIYDAAHAFGETYLGEGIGSFGDVSCFSFHATKVFNTIEGGAACFSNEDFGKELYRLKNFGIKDEETVDGVGSNAKMNEFCAAMGICNLRHIDEEIAKRKVISDEYDRLLSNVSGIHLNAKQEEVRKNYAYYPIVVDEITYGKNRDELFEYLKTNGIIARKYFYPITSSYQCFEGMFDVGGTPIALGVSKRILTLPIYADLPLDVVRRICELITMYKS